MLIDYFDINKTSRFLIKKYYLLILKVNFKAYINRYNIYIRLKFNQYKFNNKSQSILILIYIYKKPFINFINGLLIKKD